MVEELFWFGLSPLNLSKNLDCELNAHNYSELQLVKETIVNYILSHKMYNNLL